MGIFLRYSWNVKPPRWGSPADVQYAIKVNSEKIYGIDPNSIVLAMPLFWGLPALDFSGQNNYGTNHGATYKDGSLDFDGNNDWIDLGATFGGRITDYSALTISTWVKLDTKATDKDIVAKESGGANGFELRYDVGEDKWFFVVHGNGSLNYSKSAAGVNTGQWYNIVGRWNGSELSVWSDTVKGPTTVALNSITDRNVAMYIGSNIDYGNNRIIDGLIDEVRIANVTRTADQIALFHDLPWGLYQPVSRPVYFFQAAEGISIPVVDHHLQQHWRA